MGNAVPASAMWESYQNTRIDPCAEGKSDSQILETLPHTSQTSRREPVTRPCLMGAVVQTPYLDLRAQSVTGELKSNLVIPLKQNRGEFRNGPEPHPMSSDLVAKAVILVHATTNV